MIDKKSDKSSKLINLIKEKKIFLLYLIAIILILTLVINLTKFNFNLLTGNSVKITGEAIKTSELNTNKLIKEPVEIKEKRDYNSQTYKNPDGTYTAIISASNEFFFNGSEFSEIEKISQPRIEKKDIILNKKPAFGNNVFELGTYTLAEGINVSIDLETQELVLRDANNKILQVLPRPFSIDANNNTLFNNYKISQNKKKLTISVEVDKNWLEEATYPVTIDPVTITILITTYMGDITENGFLGYERGENSTVVGEDCTFGTPECHPSKGFVEFVTTAIPDTAAINDTRLNLSVSSYTNGCGDPALTISLTRFNNSQISSNTTYPRNTTGNQALYNNISTGYNGLGSYASGLTGYTTVGEKTQDLGTSGDQDLQSQLVNNFFGVGIDYGGSASSQCIHTIGFNTTSSASGYPKLHVNYTFVACSVPGSGDFTCNQTCTFTNQELTIFSGDIIVQDSCNLTLAGKTNVTFTHANHFIYVYSGGNIFVNDTAGFNKKS